MAGAPPKPLFFPTPVAFRGWLKQHHAAERELLVGFYKKGSGRPSITWPEAVDEALCVGWIDGIRKSVDESSYTIRFTPRKSTSNWSAVNIKRVAELSSQRRMRATGLRAFANRSEAKSGIYAYEQREDGALNEASESQFRANAAAWKYFQAQPAWYRKVAIWRVISAKREDTRQRRLATLIEESEKGRRT